MIAIYIFAFGIVWGNQGAGNVNTFLREFKLRPKDCHQ